MKMPKTKSMSRKRRSGNQLSRSSKRQRQAYAPSKTLISGTNPQNHVVVRGIGMPDKLTTNLVYSDSFVLDPTAASPFQSKRFRWNSVFDPDYEVGGGQPTYFDPLSAMYERYLVNGAKLTAVFSRSTATTANIGPYICGIATSGGTSVVTTDTGSLISTPNVNYALVSDQDGSVPVVSTYSAKKCFDPVDNTDGSQTTTNPTRTWLAHVFAQPQGVDVEAPINVVVMIEYNVTFSGLRAVVDL